MNFAGHETSQYAAARPRPAAARVRRRQPYTVIAVLESKGRSAFDSFDDLRREMVAQAAKLGGDALILGRESTDEAFILTGTAMVRTVERRVLGQVIVYGGATGI